MNQGVTSKSLTHVILSPGTTSQREKDKVPGSILHFNAVGIEKHLNL
jgi:hypothetical protein